MIPIFLGILYWYSLYRDFAKNAGQIVSLFLILKTLFLPLIVLLVLSTLVKPYMAYEYNKISLCYNLLVMGLIVLISILVSVCCNREMYSLVKSIIRRWIERNYGKRNHLEIMIISKMKKMFRLLFTSEISSFISPSIDISEKQSDYEALIEAPNLDYVNRYEKN